jgi:ABC-2 type transport system ATP-binding protein
VGFVLGAGPPNTPPTRSNASETLRDRAIPDETAGQRRTCNQAISVDRPVQLCTALPLDSATGRVRVSSSDQEDSMASIVSVKNLTKTYKSGFQALKSVNLEIAEGEILALLGPNGAGKTTLISTICGIVQPTSGSVTVGGHDVVREFRATRDLIGLVPQEITLEPFEKVFNAVSFSRGLFGKPANPAHVEKVLRQLSLWDKKDSAIMPLSGGMKRRVLIAKALAHEPQVLFLDEPSAGVDVELRRDMWAVVADLKAQGVTIILTTHYIEEAEAIADRVGVINKGEILLVEDKAALMRRMGQKQLHVDLAEPVTAVPEGLRKYALELGPEGSSVIYTYDTKGERTGIVTLLNDLRNAGLQMTDLVTRQSSLEDIFVGLVREKA